MKKEIKEKWLVALRSGEYKQGKHQLKHNDFYCCLGVLCDIYHKETGKGRWDDGIFEADGELVSGVPPWSVVNWAEFSEPFQNPEIKSKDSSLAQLNDNGLSFAEIADLIEKEL